MSCNIKTVLHIAESVIIVIAGCLGAQLVNVALSEFGFAAEYLKGLGIVRDVCSEPVTCRLCPVGGYARNGAVAVAYKCKLTDIVCPNMRGRCGSVINYLFAVLVIEYNILSCPNVSVRRDDVERIASSAVRVIVIVVVCRSFSLCEGRPEDGKRTALGLEVHTAGGEVVGCSDILCRPGEDRLVGDNGRTADRNRKGCRFDRYANAVPLLVLTVKNVLVDGQEVCCCSTAVNRLCNRVRKFAVAVPPLTDFVIVLPAASLKVTEGAVPPNRFASSRM